MKIKKILLIILLVIIIIISVIALFNTNKPIEKSNKKQIVASNFASYDFIRAIIGKTQEIEIVLLLEPGKDSHSYEPTAKDLITIQNADMFVYIGGQMESWSEKVLNSINMENTKVICLTNYVKTIEEYEEEHEEEHKEEHHHEETGAFDEHIWTSPDNAKIIVNELEKQIENLDSENIEQYKKNAQEYIAKIEQIDIQIKEILKNKVRNILVFGDKMPMQYFIQYYNLEVRAAFDGCSTEVEPSASTIAKLVKIVKEENIPVVLYIELNDGKVAKTIVEEANNGSKALQIQSLHNISQQDFAYGENWVSLMQKNIEVLKKALQ